MAFTILIICLGVTVGACYYCFRKKDTQPKYYFLRSDNKNCQVCHINKTSTCGLGTCSYDVLMKVVNFINNSSTSVDICNPIIVLEDVTEAILKAFHRGVHVRIVTSTLSDATPALLRCMMEGIQVKGLGESTEYMMHNKFMVIDKKILLRGSLNWTNYSLFRGSFENLQILQKKEQVDFYLNQFDSMWWDDNPKHRYRKF